MPQRFLEYTAEFLADKAARETGRVPGSELQSALTNESRLVARIVRWPMEGFADQQRRQA